jgi:acetyl esterase/lipase
MARWIRSSISSSPRALDAALTALGVEHHLEIVEGAPHSFHLQPKEKICAHWCSNSSANTSEGAERLRRPATSLSSLRHTLKSSLKWWTDNP